jgi:hypothetical protein
MHSLVCHLDCSVCIARHLGSLPVLHLGYGVAAALVSRSLTVPTASAVHCRHPELRHTAIAQEGHVSAGYVWYLALHCMHSVRGHWAHHCLTWLLHLRTFVYQVGLLASGSTCSFGGEEAWVVTGQGCIITRADFHILCYLVDL